MKLLVTGWLSAIGHDICSELAKSHEVKILNIEKDDGELEYIQGG
jgi:FlaA1/EpsC-like NDP-sugar epimerase